MSSNSTPVESSPAPEASAADTRWLEIVKRQVENLKFGSVHITVHENRVVQVETSVRVRFDKSP